MTEVTVTDEAVSELRDWVLMSCDELTIALYLMQQGNTKQAAEVIEGAVGTIEVAMSVFMSGGLDS